MYVCIIVSQMISFLLSLKQISISVGFYILEVSGIKLGAGVDIIDVELYACGIDKEIIMRVITSVLKNSKNDTVTIQKLPKTVTMLLELSTGECYSGVGSDYETAGNDMKRGMDRDTLNALYDLRWNRVDYNSKEVPLN